MLIGYNPKIYIKEFVQDLSLLYKEKNMEVSITEILTDKYRLVYENLAFDISLYGIENYENNMYQELKVDNYNDSDFLNILLNNPSVKIMQRSEEYVVFIVIDDILVNE